MGLKVILWDSRPKKDGSCAVRIYLSRDKHAYHTVKGVSCKETEFDHKVGRVKRSRNNWQSINTSIAIAYNKFEKLMIDNPQASVDRIIELYKGNTDSNTEGKLIPFAETLVKECEAGKIPRTYNTYKKYTTVINHLKKYNQDIKFTDINKNFYDTFTALLRNDYKHRENTVGGTIKIIKVFLNEANERGLCNVTEHKKKYFKTIQEETDAIYLTESELEKIINLDLFAHPGLAEERDRFIAATYLMLRWSDSVRAGKVNFFQHKEKTYFKQRHQKTNNEVVVPVKPIVKEIFERNNYILRFSSAQKSNDRLKKIGKMADIDEEMTLNGFSRKEDGSPYRKYDFITTHTARRSGATNFYLAGMDKKMLMNFGGWKTEKDMLKYIRVGKLEAAELLSEHPVFK